MKHSYTSTALALALGLTYGATVSAGERTQEAGELGTGAASAEGGAMMENRTHPSYSTAHGDAAPRNTFSKMDTDEDGYISKEEASSDAAMSDNWDSADRDADGRLDESEFSAMEVAGEASTTPSTGDTGGTTGMSNESEHSGMKVPDESTPKDE